MPPSVPQWQAMLSPLQTNTWIAFMAAFVTATIVLSLLSKASWTGDPQFPIYDCERVAKTTLEIAGSGHWVSQ